MDEKMRILKMVEEGTVTADEAYQLMEAMGADREIMTAPIKDYDKRLLHIQVESMKGDNVNIQLPVSAVKKITRATGKLPIPEKALHGIDIDELMEAIRECLDAEVEGDLVNVNPRGDDKVRIYVE